MRLVVWLFPALLFSFAVADPITPPPPLRAPGDSSAFRHVVLDNGLRVLLYSNPKLNLSSAALAVDTGSFDNPENRPGLAHYLEHLLFLGTDRYPDPGEFDKFIQASGGSNNAYTASDHTNYHLQISHEAFPGALERLSRFFIAPRFDADFCGREVTAIENEFQRHRDNDFARLEFVCNGLYAPASPDAQFSIGNRATLAGTPRDEVIAFFQSHYSADHMALVLCSSADLDRLEALARRYFSDLPRRTSLLAHPVFPHFLPRKTALRTVQIVSAKNNPKLVLLFPSGPIRTDFAAKPVELASSLLAAGGPGSLLAVLKTEDLALSIDCELDDRASDHGAFMVAFDLTEKGRAHTDRVLQLFFSYVRLFQAAPYPRETFAEHAAFARRDEAYTDRGEGLELAASLARAALQYPFECSERIAFLWLLPDEPAYRRLLDSLQPDNLLAVLLAPDLPTDQKEKYYGFAYHYSEQTGSAYDALLQTPPEAASFHLPSANPFADASTAVLASEPVRLIDEPGLSLWFAQETDLARPQVSYRFLLRPGAAAFSARDAARLSLFKKILQLSLQDVEADAHAAGIQFSVETGTGLQLSVSGYSGSAERFFEQLVRRLTSLTVDQAAFTTAREQAVASLASFPHSEAFEIGFARLRAVREKPAFLPTDLLDSTRAFTRQEILDTIPALFATARIEGLACGNVAPAEAARLTRLLRDSLHSTPPATGHPARKSWLKLAAGDTVVDAQSVSGPNSFVCLVFAYPADTPEYRAAASLVGNFIGDDFYADLRTHQQLGYIVAANSNTDSPALCTQGLVQSSEYPSDELRRRIETYFASLPQRWSALTPAQFATLRDGLRSQLQARPNNASDRADFFFKIATDFSAGWQQTQDTLAALDRLTPSRVGQIINELLATSTRRLVIEQLSSESHPPAVVPRPSFADREAWKQERTWYAPEQ